MKWNAHWNLEGKHAFLGASKYSWINYKNDDGSYNFSKLINSYQNYQSIERGTRLHALAASMISENIKAQSVKQTFNMYVNDAIKFHLSPEVVLYVSENAFGTTDGINFDEEKNFLRIHDLKTGITPAHMEQLMIYAAYFCLEYHKDPFELGIELRIYQNNEIIVCNEETDPDLKAWIKEIMDCTIAADNELRRFKEEA